MSTTLLYQAYAIRGYRYRSMKCVPGGVEIMIEQPRDRCRCPVCGGEDVILKGCKTRRFLAPPMGSKHVTIVLNVPRVECHDCDELRQVKITFAKPNRRHIRAFEQYVLDLLQRRTFSVSRSMKLPCARAT